MADVRESNKNVCVKIAEIWQILLQIEIPPLRIDLFTGSWPMTIDGNNTQTFLPSAAR